MKKITTYINSDLVEQIKFELYKIGLDEFKISKFYIPTKPISCIEIYCGSIWEEKVKQIFKKYGTNNQWNENMFFVENINYNDNSYLIKKK